MAQSTDNEHSVLELFASAGAAEPRSEGFSVAAALARCISDTAAAGSEFCRLSDPEFLLREDASKVSVVIESALRSIRCPYPLDAHQIQDLDYSKIHPVVQWIVSYACDAQSKTVDEVADVSCEIEDEKRTLEQLQRNLAHEENSIKTLQIALAEQNQKDANILHEKQNLHKKLDKDSDAYFVERFMVLLKSFKADVIELEKEMPVGEENRSISDDVGPFVCTEKLNLAKCELAAKVKAVLSLKRQLSDMPSQSELIQYDRLCQTRKFYATYNALVEIKELMLKETSLLNSLISQFQEAISSTAGRAKLVNSMEDVLKGTQQKLGKVQGGLQAELNTFDALKETVARSVAEQKHFYSVLMAFQEECMRNERIRSQSSENVPTSNSA
ncbi:hypothetical protein Syun_010971 [Stephania yunnanensis]|uniref:Coiled-coil domain-containing protein 93 n=1 Tax=Stephania yunnanensis TaxID=152371 RepID=A0AAP0JWX3_9MAGN